MQIICAKTDEIELLCLYDKHISKKELQKSVKEKRVYIAKEKSEIAGWLRFNLFWDNTPFMNMLYILEGYRGKGMGKALVQRWENDMKKQGYDCLMTSTASDEYAQHFYRKLGYAAVGGFMPKDAPYEIILSKNI